MHGFCHLRQLSCCFDHQPHSSNTIDIIHLLDGSPLFKPETLVGLITQLLLILSYNVLCLLAWISLFLLTVSVWFYLVTLRRRFAFYCVLVGSLQCLFLYIYFICNLKKKTPNSHLRNWSDSLWNPRELPQTTCNTWCTMIFFFYAHLCSHLTCEEGKLRLTIANNKNKTNITIYNSLVFVKEGFQGSFRSCNL